MEPGPSCLREEKDFISASIFLNKVQPNRNMKSMPGKRPKSGKQIGQDSIWTEFYKGAGETAHSLAPGGEGATSTLQLRPRNNRFDGRAEPDFIGQLSISNGKGDPKIIQVPIAATRLFDQSKFNTTFVGRTKLLASTESDVLTIQVAVLEDIDQKVSPARQRCSHTEVWPRTAVHCGNHGIIDS